MSYLNNFWVCNDGLKVLAVRGNECIEKEHQDLIETCTNEKIMKYFEQSLNNVKSIIRKKLQPI